jgi:hypothetical protein
MFLNDIAPNNWYKWSDKRSLDVDINEYDYYEAVVKKCLSLLAVTKVIEHNVTLIPLDDADPNILPISESLKYCDFLFKKNP